ncbi:MAG: phosphoglycerate kinase [Patescibacteria group bacterium]
MHLRSIRDVKSWKGKRVFLRVDFNVPIVRGKVAPGGDWRIERALPTIGYLTHHGARVILGTHLGRPGGRARAALRLDPIAKRLGTLLGGGRVKKLPECVGRKVAQAVAKMRNGELVLLENLRFHSGEDTDDPKFAKELATLADVYVNDAFAVSHREAASVVAITKELPSYAGLLLEEEVAVLSRVTTRAKKPLVALLGGAKISTKIGTIQNLARKAGTVLLGGAITNTIFAARGYGVGASLISKEDFALAKKLRSSKKLELPVDAVIGDPKHPERTARVVEIRATPHEVCPKKFAIFDIGPRTVALYAGFLKRAQTIVWNGPLGWFEVRSGSHATRALARLIAARSSGRAFGVVGGGETIQALHETHMAHFVDHVSTGGGAMLEFLAGKTLPGIKPLIKK